MSKINLYSVFDTLSEEFGQPFLCKNDNLARIGLEKYIKRNIDNLEKDSLILYRIGSFDVSNGVLDSFTPEKIDISFSFDTYKEKFNNE